MTSPRLLRIDNDPRDYAWGAPGGIARAFGRPAGDEPEAEYWLGAHPGSPSRIVGDGPWRDLGEWETATGQSMPFLLKVLAAQSPLSLQAHPTPEQAERGFAREDAAGVARDARERNYKDAHAKPELIVAVDDGFEALCGFRPVDETLAALDGLDVAGADRLRELLTGRGGLRDAVAWLLSGDDEVAGLVTGLTAAAESDPVRWSLVRALAAAFPGDPGIAVALLLNHVRLAAGECLWLPAGNIHAYLSGTGVELMGPSDNVLRGGLTPKHIDVAELLEVLDFQPGPPPVLAPVGLGAGVVSYRPRSVASGRGIPFELQLARGDTRLELSDLSIAVVLDGGFTLGGVELAPGDAVLVDGAGPIEATGAGRLFVATA